MKAVIAAILFLEKACLVILVALAILLTIGAGGNFGQMNNSEFAERTMSGAQKYLNEHPSFLEAKNFKERFFIVYCRCLTLNFRGGRDNDGSEDN